MTTHPILIAGRWHASHSSETFHAADPAKGVELPDAYAISDWEDCDRALNAAHEAFSIGAEPSRLAKFLTLYADRIESRRKEIVEVAATETALAASPRLNDIELPRTTGQLRQAATAVVEGSAALPTINTKLNIRSCFGAIGPVMVYGPNNFPLAFNGICGGDFAAGIAAGNPVIAKAHSSHPGACRLVAEEAAAAANEAGLPPGWVQMIYRMPARLGVRMAADPRLGAIGFTGSKSAGFALKASADTVGKPIYLEVSSVNPVVILPGALRERLAKVADEFTDSCLAGSGQFCTNPGTVVLIASEQTDQFIAEVKKRFETRAATPLLSKGVADSLASSVKTLIEAGAEVITGGSPVPGAACKFANTLLRVSGDAFLAHAEKLQTEAFGNASLFIIARGVSQAAQVLHAMEGNLTGCFYTDSQGSDDTVYDKLAPILRRRVGRLINDKMPTGVAVSPAMNHGGPFPATGHPGFTAVGIPASLRRFAMLQCYDNVRAARLPALLADKNPTGKTWRLVDGAWTCEDVRAVAK